MRKYLAPFVALALAAIVVVACERIPRYTPEETRPPNVDFEATFDESGDFYDRFDFGYSGPNPWDWGNGSGAGAVTSFHGDHNVDCEGPDTDRTVGFTGDRQHLGFAELFWWCAPRGPESGHVMTGVDTISYNIAWFSPKGVFERINSVCWDVNLTEVSKRKWTQVLFVGEADAQRYPADESRRNGASPTRGTGGYDLGFTSPDFRGGGGPSTGVLPQSGTLAGFKSVLGDAPWFQNQDTWTSGELGPQITGVTDKAKRYRHCLLNRPDEGVVRLLQEVPDGWGELGEHGDGFTDVRVIDMSGQIPQGRVRVVFQDDNYDPPKDDLYDPDVVTWHWDHIAVDVG